MTVSTEVDHNEYTGNGVTTSFPYTFRIFKKTDLVVQVSDLNGNVTELVLDTGYKVTGAGTYSGGEVVLPSPLAAGWRITIERVLDVVQETDLRNQGKFFPEVHEDAFDYLTMLIQRCFGWFRRALMKPSLLAKYYDAKQNKISNLADPSFEQDAVNNRSMRNYVDAAIAGVVGGFGWFIPSGSGARQRTFQSKMRDIISPCDYEDNIFMIKELISKGKNAAVFNSYYTFVITVGEWGDYPTLKDAIIAAQSMRPMWDGGNAFCEIRIKTGHIINYQIEFSSGVDLSWIKITSEDSVVFSDTRLFTKIVRTYYEYKYLFYICDAAKSPVFAIQIEENRDDSDVCAFIVTQKAELNFYPYSGARKFYVGIHGSFGAKISAYHTGCAPDEESVAAYMPEGYYVCDFSYSRYSSLQLVNNVKASMPVSKFERCTESTVASVNCIYNVKADFQGASASYCYIGWNVRDGSNVNIRDHKTIHCSYRGLTCIHTAYVDARRHDVEESDAETSGKVLEPNIEKGFYGCALGVRIDGAGCVDVAGNDMRNCGTAVNADTGAVISGKAVDISGAELGFDCHAGASVNFPRLWGTDIKKLMHLQDGVRFNSNICHVFGANPTKDIRWIDVERSEASFMNATLDADSGFIADCGSRITIEGSKVKNQTIRSFFGSYVAINNTVADRTYSDIADVPQLTISGGSFISATGYSNSDSSPLRLSTTRNTLGVGGAIFSTNGEVS